LSLIICNYLFNTVYQNQIEANVFDRNNVIVVLGNQECKRKFIESFVANLHKV